MIINAIAALVSFYYPQTWIFPTLILAGGLVTLYTLRKQASGETVLFSVGHLRITGCIGLVKAAYNC